MICWEPGARRWGRAYSRGGRGDNVTASAEAGMVLSTVVAATGHGSFVRSFVRPTIRCCAILKSWHVGGGEGGDVRILVSMSRGGQQQRRIAVVVFCKESGFRERGGGGEKGGNEEMGDEEEKEEDDSTTVCIYVSRVYVVLIRIAT